MYLAYLGGRVVYNRIQLDHYVGDEAPADKKAKNEKVTAQDLRISSRAHANFTENVPIAFMLAAFAELNGASSTVLNYGLATLLALRIAHVEIGLYGKDALGPGRPLGTFGTYGWMLGMAGYGAYLVKGYWGF